VNAIVWASGGRGEALYGSLSGWVLARSGKQEKEAVAAEMPGASGWMDDGLSCPAHHPFPSL